MSEAHIDFDWDDDHVMPEIVNPEVAYLFQRTIEVTHKTVNPRPGERVLDVGSGRATDGVELGKTGAEMVGLEPSHVMISYSRNHISENGSHMEVVHGVGEHLPFKSHSFDKVYCKGSLDHFVDPSVAISQMSEAVKPAGEVIIAIANFESLGFKLGKTVCFLKEKLGFGAVEGRMPWDIPEDHTYRFHYSNLRQMVNGSFRIKQARGVSLLFGLPWWGSFLTRCPRLVSNGILNALDGFARYFPSISDVIVLRCEPRAQSPSD
ncbi:MAG: methyltransferase domain-containing protein [Dehalococcoidia bacterium]